MPDGKPNFQGIWQAVTSANAGLEDHVAGNGMVAGRSVVVGGTIPYKPEAAAQRAENFKNRVQADPYRKCFLPGTPRIMYLDYPFQIFQTRDTVGMTFEWQLVYRLIHTDNRPHPEDYDSWMGDSRGHWEGDVFVVSVTNHNDKTWLDMSGNWHSDALKVTERYQMTDADTIQYEATLEDGKVYSKPWTLRFALKRRTDRDRLFEYVCTAEMEEETGLFDREVRTWYPGDGSAVPPIPASTYTAAKIPAVAGLRRTPEEKPDLQRAG